MQAETYQLMRSPFAGRNLIDSEMTIPEIKAVGTYECQVKLHPEVNASFNTVIQREKNITVRGEAPNCLLLCCLGVCLLPTPWCV